MSSLHSLLRIVLLVFAVSACAAPSTADASRVGSYDSRAVAIAYYQSDAFAARLRALRESGASDADGAALQAHLHRQGFGTAPVDDVLDTVRAQIPDVMADAGVDRLVSKWDLADATTTIDVTDRLVALFDPDEATLRTVAEIREKDPVPESELRDHD